jgi:hypothetical protein
VSWGRRAICATSLALLLVGATGIAQAAFSGLTSGQVTASTLALVEPVGANVTATCSTGRRLNVAVNSYGYVPRATSYEFILLDPSGAAVTTSGGTYSAGPATKGTWTYRIRGNYTAAPGNVWTGTPHQGTVIC